MCVYVYVYMCVYVCMCVCVCVHSGMHDMYALVFLLCHVIAISQYIIHVHTYTRTHTQTHTHTHTHVHRYGGDLHFLNGVIWPLVKDNQMSHDSYTCKVCMYVYVCVFACVCVVDL